MNVEPAAHERRGTSLDTRLRVMTFVTVFGCGGTERQFMNLARGLDRRRFDLSFGCLRQWGPHLSEVEQSGTPVDAYPIPRFASATCARAQWRLASRLRRRRIDVLHAYNFYGNVFALPAARLARTPVVLASIRDRGTNLTGPQKTLQRHVCRLADRIVVNADAIRQWLVAEGYDDRRIVVIRNGIDLVPFRADATGRFRRELGVSPDVPLIGCIARLNGVKGIEHLVGALGRLEAPFDNARLVIVGDGFVDRHGDIVPDDPYLSALMRVARDCGVANRVMFTGYRADVPAILPDFDVVVSASLDEGLSNAILEAMAAGVPVVATRVGGSPEAIVDGETGRLVPPGDPDAIARAIADVLVAPGVARRMGSLGRQRVHECFSLDAMVARTAALYEELRMTGLRRRLMRIRPAEPRRPSSWTPRDQHFS